MKLADEKMSMMLIGKKILIGAMLCIIIIGFGAGTYAIGLNQGREQEFLKREPQISDVVGITSNIPPFPPPYPPCPLRQAPDGSFVPVCNIVTDIQMPIPPDEIVYVSPDKIKITEVLEGETLQIPSSGVSNILSAGMGTTTLNKKTPLNDILIAETGSPYASLRNARYTTWPYPGEIPIKQVYLILPEIYEPIFPGYSNHQLVELPDGSKHILIHLRHKESSYIGADARIFIQSPSPTSETDHPLTQFDSTESWTGFSIVSKRQEVIVEVFFSEQPVVPPPFASTARQELLESVKRMEIIW